MQCKTLFLSVLAFVLLWSCNAVEGHTPLMVTLRRGANTVHLFGTLHDMPQYKVLELQEASPAYLTAALSDSDIAAFEYVELPDDYHANVTQRFLLGTEQYPSISDRINEWPAEEREAFVASLNQFPGLGHVARQDLFMSMQPWAAHAWLDQQLVGQSLGAATGTIESVDDWLKEEARELRLPMVGLQDEVPYVAARAFSRMDQEASMLSVQALVMARPSIDELLTAWRDRESSVVTLYLEGVPTDPASSGLHEALSIPDDQLEELRQLSQRRNQSDSFLEREAMMASVIEDTLTNGADTIFVAVGAAHLSTPGWLLHRLTARGFEIVDVYPEAMRPALESALQSEL